MIIIEWKDDFNIRVRQDQSRLSQPETLAPMDFPAMREHDGNGIARMYESDAAAFATYIQDLTLGRRPEK